MTKRKSKPTPPPAELNEEYDAAVYLAQVRELRKKGFQVIPDDDGVFYAYKQGQQLSVCDRSPADMWRRLIAIRLNR